MLIMGDVMNSDGSQDMGDMGGGAPDDPHIVWQIDKDFRCNNPSLPNVCYAIKHAGAFENVYTQVNRFVGHAPGLTKLFTPSPKLGPAITIATVKLINWIIGQVDPIRPWTKGFDRFEPFLKLVIQPSKEVLSANVLGITAGLDAYATAASYETVLPPMTITTQQQPPKTSGGGAGTQQTMLPPGVDPVTAQTDVSKKPDADKTNKWWWIAAGVAAFGVGILGFIVYKRRADGAGAGDEQYRPRRSQMQRRPRARAYAN